MGPFESLANLEPCQSLANLGPFEYFFNLGLFDSLANLGPFECDQKEEEDAEKEAMSFLLKQKWDLSVVCKKLPFSSNQ